MPAPLATTITPPAVGGFDLEMRSFLPGGELLGDAPAPAEEIETEADGIEEEPINVGSETEVPGEETAEEKATREAAEAQAEADRVAAEAEAEKQKTDPERKEWPSSAQKRVDKLTAQKTEIERERDALKAQADTAARELAELKAKGPAPTPAPTPENPLAGVMEAKELPVFVQFNQAVQDWAIEHSATGGTLPAELDAIITGRTTDEAEANPSELTPREVGGLLKVANQRLTRDIPQRQQWLRMDTQAKAYVTEHYPQMLQAESEEGQLYAQFEREFPEIKRLPTWRVALVDCVRGAQLRIAEEKQRTAKGAPAPAGTAPKPTVKETPPLAPVPPGAPRGASTRPVVAKPQRSTVLKATMSADELAEAM